MNKTFIKICFQKQKSGDYDDEAHQLSVSCSFRDSPWQNFFATPDFRRHPFERHKPHYHPNVFDLGSFKMQNRRVYNNLVFEFRISDCILSFEIILKMLVKKYRKVLFVLTIFLPIKFSLIWRGLPLLEILGQLAQKNISSEW